MPPVRANHHHRIPRFLWIARVNCDFLLRDSAHSRRARSRASSSTPRWLNRAKADEGFGRRPGGVFTIWKLLSRINWWLRSGADAHVCAGPPGSGWFTAKPILVCSRRPFARYASSLVRNRRAMRRRRCAVMRRRAALRRHLLGVRGDLAVCRRGPRSLIHVISRRDHQQIAFLGSLRQVAIGPQN